MSARSPEQALAGVLSLLPSGWALSRRPDSNFGKSMSGVADALARFEQYAVTLLEESDPRTATQLVPDYERVLGPNPGVADPATLTLDQRRQSNWQRWTAKGGASRPFFVQIASQLGYTASIHEYTPFYAGVSNAGDLLYDQLWAFVWTLRSAEPPGANQALLEASIRRFLPEHTEITFEYGVAA